MYNLAGAFKGWSDFCQIKRKDDWMKFVQGNWSF